MTREEYIKFANALKNNYTIDFNKLPEFCDMAISALSAEPCREADDYENEIADLHNRLDIAEYDKERYKEEITTLEAKNKGEWINNENGTFTCNKCGEISCCNGNFCCECGADMRGD